MKQISQKDLWNNAGKAGLILGLISTAYMFVSQLLSQSEIPSFINSITSFVLWTAKFIGCIWVMKMFMNRFAAEYNEVRNKDTFRLGLAMSLLSAIVYSAFTFANVAFISADMYNEQMTIMLEQMAPMLDSNTMTVMDSYIENLPKISFISNLIYCFIYGTIISYILSRNIPGKDPFAEFKPDEQ